METKQTEKAANSGPLAELSLDPLADGVGELSLQRVSGSDLDIANAARVSYRRKSEQFGESDERLIRVLIEHGHMTPFEQTFLQFRVKAPIFVVRHWVRHRIGVSYNEASGRYTEFSGEYYMPKIWRVSDPQNRHAVTVETVLPDAEELHVAYEKTVGYCLQTYKRLIDAGVVKELARVILPVCMYTEFVFGCNMRSLLHFVSLRDDVHAQWEIRQYARGMLDLAQRYFPVAVRTWRTVHEQRKKD